jgi:hypothetical protein
MPSFELAETRNTRTVRLENAVGAQQFHAVAFNLSLRVVYAAKVIASTQIGKYTLNHAG